MTVLTPRQIEELQVSLRDLEMSLEEVLESTSSGAKPVQLKDNVGRLSRMDEMHNQSILKANRNVLANRLKGIKVALLRMEKGDYGFCDDCDTPISFARLKAYPDARLCIECQSERE